MRQSDAENNCRLSYGLRYYHSQNRFTPPLRVDILIINVQEFAMDNIDNVPDFIISSGDDEPKRKKSPAQRLKS